MRKSDNGSSTRHTMLTGIQSVFTGQILRTVFDGLLYTLLPFSAVINLCLPFDQALVACFLLFDDHSINEIR